MKMMLESNVNFPTFLTFILVLSCVFSCNSQVYQATLTNVNNTEIAVGTFKLSGPQDGFKVYTTIFSAQNPNAIALVDGIRGTLYDIYQRPPYSFPFSSIYSSNDTIFYRSFTDETLKLAFVVGNDSYVSPLSSGCIKPSLDPPQWEMWVMLSLVALVLMTLVTNLLYPHYVFLVAAVIILLCQIITLPEFLAGFSNEGLLTVAVLFPIVKPVSQTGILQFLAKYVFVFKKWPRISLVMIMLTVGFLSMFLNNTPIVALFIPIVKDWCTKNGDAPSKYLIPLSYATIGGGMCTLIGTSTNLVVHGFLQQKNSGFGFFELGYVGLPLFAIMLIYLTIFAFLCLPNNRGGMFGLLKQDGKKFLSEIDVNTFPDLKGMRASELKERFKVDIVEIIRNKKDSIERIVPVLPTELIEEGDHLLLSGHVHILINMMSTAKVDVEDMFNEDYQNMKEKLKKQTELESTPMNLQNEQDNPIGIDEAPVEDVPHVQVENIDYLKQVENVSSPSEIENAPEGKKEIFFPVELVHEQKGMGEAVSPTIVSKKNTWWDNIVGFYQRVKARVVPGDDRGTIEYFEVVLSNQNVILGDRVNGGTFQTRYNASVIAIRRMEEDLFDFTKTTFKQGDTILMMAKSSFYTNWIDKNDFFVITRSNPDTSLQHERRIITVFGKSFNVFWLQYFSIPVFFGIVIAAAANVPMIVASLVGLLVLNALNVIDPQESLNAIDWSLLILIGSSFGIGKGIQNSGLALAFSNLILSVPFPSYLLPAVVFIMTQILSTMVTNNAAATIVFPVAVSISQISSVQLKPLAVAVAIAASSDFSTPIGYQTNLMVQGPGNYRFLDYLKIGFPLNLIYLVSCSILIPLIWKMH